MKPGVRTYLLLGFAVVVGLFAVATAVTVFSIARVARLEHHLDRLDTARHHGHMTLSAFQEQYIHQAHSLIVDNRSHLDHYSDSRKAAVERIRCLESACAAIGLAARVEPIRIAVEEMHERFMNDVVPALGTEGLPDPHEHHKRLEDLTDRARALTEELNTLLDGRSAQARGDLASVLDMTGKATIGFLSATAIIAVAVGFVLFRLIGRPLANLHGALARVGTGRLDTRIDPRGPRELLELARRFNDMTSALAESQETIARSERLAAMGQMAAAVAHELNNPLGVITGYLKVVRRLVQDPAVTSDLAIIADEVDQCSRIVHSLIELARPASLRLESTDLVDLVRESVERIDRAKDGEANVALRLSEAPLWCGVDSSAYRRVLMNLLSNAIDAAGKGGSIAVTLRAEGKDAVLEVSDSGPGIPPAERARIFQPFHTTKPKGLGLGLAICDDIVRGHHGRIEIGTGAEGGARFRVFIPCHSASSADPAERAP